MVQHRRGGNRATCDQQQLIEREHGDCGLERHEYHRTESTVDYERREPELRQCDSEHFDDAVVDANIYGDISGNRELGCNYWDWLYNRRGQFARDAESHPIDDPAGGVWSDSDWGSNWATFDQQQLVEREHGYCGLERHEYHRTESSVDDKRREPEFRKCDGEHFDDAVVDVDVYRHIFCHGEFGIDYGGGLYPRRRYFTGHAEPNSVDDPAGAICSDSDWGSNRAAFDQQQLVEREHGDCGLERHEYHRTESTVDDKRREPELRQCDSEHCDDAVVDVDIYGHISCHGELGIDFGRWLYHRREQLAGDAEPNAVDDPAGAV